MNSKTNSTNSQTKSKSKSSKADDSMLEDFFVDELKDIFWAEKHLVKTLPKMEKAATTQVLKPYIMATKDHKHVKDDDKYEALREKGMSKERAAKISNSPGASKRGGEHSHSKKK